MSKTILLVEDTPTDEKLARLAFRRSSPTAEVVVVRDGAAALDYLFGVGAYAECDRTLAPAVVLLDLMLPRIGGLEVLRRLRADPRTRYVPVVILTGSAEEEDVVQSYALGANAYVRKPGGFVEFAEAARVLGRFWIELNQPVPFGSVAS